MCPNSRQLVNLYAETIGGWSRPLILTAAFVPMFSTTLTCVDGYPRALAACCSLIGDLPPKRFRQIQNLWTILAVCSASLVVLFFVQNLVQLLTFAAIISFMTSPILAYINYRVMCGANVPAAQRPGPILKTLSWLGLAFFTLMAAGFLFATFVHRG
ncbi:hypothetical protein SAMN05660860_03205 [Geoalkalibacter ferrihydriticus]|uniref:Natural resistance-associated macrophage protein n=1 Tax=Geoalkalibacter ferrihydriticus TaxID=392333 RepID=A0A1G9W8B6_9BACT|nr:hypothetical protein [Geoalkalibacter ferrihydriticus]SDM80778.1 hypothetical protein SAMN05660860_03205 [Geoalkalibacter ferrihydriticus]